MTRAEVNEIIVDTNCKLIKAGKMFRVKTVNLLEKNCSRCDSKVIVEQTNGLEEEPVCQSCINEMFESTLDDPYLDQ